MLQEFIRHNSNAALEQRQAQQDQEMPDEIAAGAGHVSESLRQIQATESST